MYQTLAFYISRYLFKLFIASYYVLGVWIIFTFDFTSGWKKKILSFSMGYESHFLMDESLYRVGVESEILWALIPDPSKHWKSYYSFKMEDAKQLPCKIGNFLLLLKSVETKSDQYFVRMCTKQQQRSHKNSCEIIRSIKYVMYNGYYKCKNTGSPRNKHCILLATL